MVRETARPLRVLPRGIGAHRDTGLGDRMMDVGHIVVRQHDPASQLSNVTTQVARECL
jgi:hypothetical protein